MGLTHRSDGHRINVSNPKNKKFIATDIDVRGKGTPHVKYSSCLWIHIGRIDLSGSVAYEGVVLILVAACYRFLLPSPPNATVQYIFLGSYTSKGLMYISRNHQTS